MDGIAASSIVEDSISVQDWIESANRLPSRNDFIRSAVELAWMLTKRLTEIASEVNRQDITATNVLIFVERPRSPPWRGLEEHELPNQRHDYPSIRDVRFQFDAWADETTPLEPLDACSALGTILLEIFSMGRSCSIDTTQVRMFKTPEDDTTDGNMMPPTQKRQATAPTASYNSASSTANDLLHDLGMPISVRRIVCDLLDATNEQRPSSSLTSLEEALKDLDNMKNDPQAFLHDQMCPKKALELFHGSEKQLFGRGKELDVLMEAKAKISSFVDNEGSGSLSHGTTSFSCEAVFLSGYAGSGKSSLLHQMMDTCTGEEWFVLSCKFDKQASPLTVLAKAFDDFFGKWMGLSNDAGTVRVTTMTSSFRQVCRSILSAVDDDGYSMLCELVPNLRQMFPVLAGNHGFSSLDKVGLATERRLNLLNVLFKSLCSSGRPALFVIDDLQWSDQHTLEAIADYTTNPSGNRNDVRSQGLLILGAFRSNEVVENGELFKMIDSIEQANNNVTRLVISELAKDDLNNLISAKLCLPVRYTHELAQLVCSKTNGNPFFAIEFLKHIINDEMLVFSVKSRRWEWALGPIDKQVISRGVAGLLVRRLSQLSTHSLQALKIASCFGSQVEDSTIYLLNLRQQVLQHDMHEALDQAIEVGIMRKTGRAYQFSHDLLQQSVYELIPDTNRNLLHKTVGKNLMKSTDNDPHIYLLAVDQINIYCEDGRLSSEERSEYAGFNAEAGKYAIAASNFEQARSYIDKGMKLLDTSHWETQYALSLDLYEMRATIACMYGDKDTMSASLDAVLSHVKTFGDSLNASGLLSKLLASSSKFEDAISNCLMILEHLGEIFPQIGLPRALNELSMIESYLKDISIEQVKSFAPMTDERKLNAMKWLNMLCAYCVFGKPMLLPLASCRMVSLSLKYGFCDDSIVGFATAGYALFTFTNNKLLAYQLGKLSEVLIEESPNKHALRSRLFHMWNGTVKIAMEPATSVLFGYSELHHSATLAGDVENAVLVRWTSCMARLVLGHRLLSMMRHIKKCIRKARKYHQYTLLHSTMPQLDFCQALSCNKSEMEVKSYEELNEMGKRSSDAFLLWNNFFCKLSTLFWTRDYAKVAELSEQYTSSQHKRMLEVIRTFYEGIAFLSLARDTKQSKWKVMGERALVEMSSWASISNWNFDNKYKLLQAELYYVNRDLESAEVAYNASIDSARAHKWSSEEALAHELYGRFCIENKSTVKGTKHIRMALDGYKRWGALTRVNDLQKLLICAESQKKMTGL